MNKVLGQVCSFMRNLDKRAVLAAVREFFNSYVFYIFETIAACLFVAAGQEVAGAVFFVALICMILLVCDDILPTTLPFLLISAFTTNLYDSYDLFIPYIRYAPAAVICLLFHFIRYRQPMKTGESAYGILAVSVAVMLGGIGRFSIMDYVRGAYYVLGLGFGMLAVYFLMRSQFSVKRNYDLRQRFSVIMTLLGLLCAFIIASGYYKTFHDIPTSYALGFSRNNISTLLMFAMPFPLFLALKRPWTALLSLVFYGAIAVTTSRGGLLFGTMEVLFCCAYWIFSDGKRILRTVLCLVSLAIIFLCFRKIILDVIYDRLLAEGAITGEVRYKMMWEAIEKFKKNPLVGFGILDQDIAYAADKKKGSMAWYHMMTSQVVGSMGLVGIAAYLFQFIGRVKLIFRNFSMWSLCLGVSYLGILLMSQVNPGEFCPLPFELLTVLLFILQERRLENDPLPLKGTRKLSL